MKRILFAYCVFIGTTTDGEYCSLRSLGQSNVTHLWDLVRQSKLAVAHKSKDSLEKMIFPIGGNS